MDYAMLTSLSLDFKCTLHEHELPYSINVLFMLASI